ncbi:hypothetical protein EYF80_005372 [Liparis tanakae]|uniref:Uncharacterized protein n=1 Tax=Liparis tanakae TaxID=230148 RepID=A0A4Z2J2D9_9TELE|nr:hypothetical protein EYF80_005372 [Liparis tanakae]
MWELTVSPEEVIEKLEEGKAVPALRGLDLQSGVHVDGIEGQEGLCMLHHEVCPPCKGLQTQQEGGNTGSGHARGWGQRWEGKNSESNGKRAVQITQVTQMPVTTTNSVPGAVLIQDKHLAWAEPSLHSTNTGGDSIAANSSETKAHCDTCIYTFLDLSGWDRLMGLASGTIHGLDPQDAVLLVIAGKDHSVAFLHGVEESPATIQA